MNSPISRMGGKKLLRNAICERFPPPESFDRYIEVFGGAAWVLFHKDKHAELEVYNDADGELVNLMRCIRYHAEELQREISFYCNSREMFEEAGAQLQCRGFTDIQRAARYFVRMKISFGSSGRTFGCNVKNLAGAADYLTKAQERLRKNSVVIERKDFENLINVYDRPRALFYCDPPYYKAEKYYNIPFDVADHERLKQCLNGIKGLFLLSYNDCDFVRELYKDFKIEEVSRANNLTTGDYKELIISNF